MLKNVDIDISAGAVVKSQLDFCSAFIKLKQADAITMSTEFLLETMVKQSFHLLKPGFHFSSLICFGKNCSFIAVLYRKE